MLFAFGFLLKGQKLKMLRLINWPHAEDDHQADEDHLHVELGLVRVEEPAHAARSVVSILVKVTIVEGEPSRP